MRFILKFFLLIALSQIVAAHQLPNIENRIKNNVVKQKTQQLELLEKIVNINSGTNNITGIQQTGEILKQQLEQLGFKTYWVNEPENMKRAPTLIAEHSGKKGKRLLLLGHLDTVFSKESPFQRFTRNGDIATGQGVIDDKGGDVVLLYALKALAAAHALDNAAITVILTGDEEDSGKPVSISRKPFFDAAQHSDIALDFEWSFTKDTATIARRGISSWTIETTGTEAHSSEIFQPSAGYGAIFELTRILNTMRTTLANTRYLSFSPGIIAGGTTIQYNKSEATTAGKDNIIAKNAMAKGDLRFLTADQKNSTEIKIAAIVSQHLPGTSAQIHFQEGIPSMPPSLSNSALLKKYSQVSQDLGYGKVKPLDPSLRGAGDISHISAIVSANLAGLGAIGTGAHSANETLDVGSLTMQTQRAALLIYRLTQS